MGTAKPREGQCTYAYRDGKRCTSEIEARGQFCFWHDPAANKESPDIKDRLQEWARSHRYLEGIKLRYAQLEGIKLGGSKGVDLSNADLFHANLKKARLTNVNLKDANLVKTDLSRARLSQVNIQDANLMGVQLRGAKMDRVDWGKAVLNEKLGAAAERKGKEHQAFQCYREALLVYQHLGRVYARNRDGKMASRLFMREMEMQRKLMPRGSVAWLWSMLVDLVCGYGEKPLRVFGLAFVIVLISGGFYSYTMASSVPLVRVGSTCYWAFRPRSVWWRMRSISSIARFSARRSSFRWAIPTRSMRGRRGPLRRSKLFSAAWSWRFIWCSRCASTSAEPGGRPRDRDAFRIWSGDQTSAKQISRLYYASEENG